MSKTNCLVKDDSSFGRFQTEFCRELQNCIHKMLENYCVCDTTCKISFERENGTAKKGDYSIHLPSILVKANDINNQSICDIVQSKLKEKITKCYIGPHNRIIINLNHQVTYSSVIKEVMKGKSEYGNSDIGYNLNVLILPHYTNNCSLTDLRTQFILQHVALILSFNGYRIYLPEDLSVAQNSKNIIYYKCNEQCCDLSNVREARIQLAHQSKWKIDLKNNDGSLSTNTIVLDGKQYLMEKNDNSSHYSKNIGNLYVSENENILKQSAVIKHVIENHTDAILSMIIHIVPENKSVSVQQSGLFFEMIDDPTISQHYLVHGKTVSKLDSIVTEEQYIKKKTEEVKSSLILKYGPYVMQEKAWQTCISELINTVIKFDFLHTKYSALLKINTSLSEEDSSANGKSGAFVQYNCARLSMLFKHFEERVKTGYYQPLPSFEDIDLTELRLHEEWSLFYNYVFPFPLLVRELVESLPTHSSNSFCIPTHKIPKMLLHLSQEFSIYYNKTHVLTDPYPQLQKRMFARLYLLQSIHQVMKCGLALLNLTAINKM